MYLTKLTDNNIKVHKLLDPNLRVSGITSDSRQTKKGMIFAIIKGKSTNGNNYVSEAYKNGAVAILCNKIHLSIIREEIKNILVCDNVRLSVSKIAKHFFPKQPSNVSVVTGTNGKTSIVNFLYDIWKINKIKGASFGTLGIRYNKKSKKTKLTTLDPISLHKEINNLKEKNINFLAMEASSHALDQHRLDNVKVKYALFTNLSRDHLDYHKSMKSYFLSKSRLFESILEKKGIAVINIDNKYGSKIKEICEFYKIKYFTYGFKKESYWKIIKVKRLNNYTKVEFKKNNVSYIFKCNLIANYEIENLLGAIILANLNGLSIKNIIKSTGKIKQSEGRLKKVKLKKNHMLVFIDYAHTPEALKKSLEALISVKKTNGKLFLVFGCGGDRDKGKRKIMGKIANKLADKIFITDDNPRFENAKKIREEIASTCKKAINIANRKQAIYRAIKLMSKKDILLIAGKGHEKYQETKGRVIYFDDEITVKQIINEGYLL